MEQTGVLYERGGTWGGFLVLKVKGKTNNPYFSRRSFVQKKIYWSLPGGVKRCSTQRGGAARGPKKIGAGKLI